MAVARKEKAYAEIKRFFGFLGSFRHNRRGLLGIAILVFFVLLATLSPFMTPYNPATDTFLSGDYSVPFWLRYFPGNEVYSENSYMMSQPGFDTPESFSEGWNYTATSQISVAYDATWGNEKPGSIALTYTRQAGRYTGMIAEAHLTRQFSYLSSGPPKRFLCTISWTAEEVETLSQAELAIFLYRVEGNASELTTYALWTNRIQESTSIWESPDPVLDSYQVGLRQRLANVTTDPAILIFPKPANYIYDLRIRFVDSPTPARIEATIHIDDINIRFWGTSFGLLGTDYKGRDIFTQLAYGSRISLFVGLTSALLSVIVGLSMGLIAGYLGRVVDEIVMRFTDMLLVLPELPLLIVLIAVLGPSVWNIVILVALLGWMGFARTVRSQVLSLKERPFIEAAKAIGAGKFHIMIRHVLPNVMSLVYVSLALGVPAAILSEAALSWLGLFDPSVVSWGRMLHDAQFQQGIDKWWWILPPGLCIAAVSLSFVFLGYALDEILNPKLRQRR